MGLTIVANQLKALEAMIEEGELQDDSSSSSTGSVLDRGGLYEEDVGKQDFCKVWKIMSLRFW